MNRFFSFIWGATVLALMGSSLSQAQSPNLTGAAARLDMTSYQLLSGRNAANGYVGLSGASMVDPAFLYPNFSSAADGTIWVKSGSTLAPQASSVANSTGITSQGIHIGQFDSTLYGISQETSPRPLVLKAHSASAKIYIYYGQSIGGANAGHTAFTWSISSSGVFSMTSGQLAGNLDLNDHNILEAGQIVGTGAAAMTADFGAGTISGATDLSLLAGTGGVLVPDTTTSTAVGRALNRGSANTIYARLGSANTYSAPQTFTVQPVFSVPLSISQTSGLQASLDGKLPLAGGTMSGAIAMGTSKITGLGDPSSAQDAATKTYADARTTASTGGILTDLVATAPLVKGMAANVTTLSMPAATDLVAGYLSAADHAAFSAKSGALSATAPLTLVSGVIAMPAATTSVSGYLTYSDYVTFNTKESVLTFTAPLSRSSNTVSMAASTNSVPGYMTAADHVILTSRAAAGANSDITSLTGLTTAITELQGGTGKTAYTNGQLLIGNTATGLTKATLTAGSGVTVTNGDGSVTIAISTVSVANGGLGANNSSLVADRFLYTSGTGAFSAATVTSAGRALIDDADNAAQRTTLGFLTATGTLDFGSVAAGGAVEELTITVTGAAVGDAVILGLPATIDSGMVFMARVTSTNTVTITAVNTKASGDVDPASASYRVTVIH